MTHPLFSAAWGPLGAGRSASSNGLILLSVRQSAASLADRAALAAAPRARALVALLARYAHGARWDAPRIVEMPGRGAFRCPGNQRGAAAKGAPRAFPAPRVATPPILGCNPFFSIGFCGFLLMDPQCEAAQVWGDLAPWGLSAPEGMREKV
jgi:hypothetical protein